MATEYFPQASVERLISIGRAVLAASSLVAIWLDPTEPARYAALAYALMILYAGYAVLLAFAVHRAGALSARLPILTHVLDLVYFTIFQYFTEGATSPFFVYFVFSLLCATLRWQWWGVLWTAPAALVAFLALGAFGEHILRDHEFELNRFIIRSAYLGVMAALLGYLGAYEAARRAEMSKLAGWPSAVSSEPRTTLHDVLQHAASTLRAPRVLVAWEERDEPWLQIVFWARGEFGWNREPPDAFGSLVVEGLRGVDFLCSDASVARPVVARRTPTGLDYWNKAPLHPEFQARFAVRSVFSAVLRGEGLEGRLFALDKTRMTSDDLVLAGIVGGQIVSSIEQLYLLRQLQQAAALEERVRVARDLHDGLLQSLTGIALRLKTAQRLEPPGAGREQLAEVQRLISAEQRDLRSFIQALKPIVPDADMDFNVASRLRELATRMERQWEVEVDLKMQPLAAPISRALARELYLIVHESLVNAAKHSGATAIQVKVVPGDRHVRVSVSDNGRGFPFHGRYDLVILDAMNLGPVSLRHRIRSRAGELVLESTPSGSRLEMSLPLAIPEA